MQKRLYSIKESLDSFMVVCATETEYKQMYDCKVQAESSIAPFISLIGTLDEPQSFMIDFDNIIYKVFNFAKAVDICFKAYNVFNMAYAEPCAAMWDFINRQFYQLTINAKPKPGIEALLNEIKIAKETNLEEDTNLPSTSTFC
ncbi:uncharacterized protein LOC118733709 [Rhagoletis pomonella]|uniref:uncharacterized protein LOC118733709 n=1 Tax=Rhagoletis pomonella TaxID=28610 RepID=UPI001784BF53|nr:uncharacterized protein LOC118733709 [Rhagoletis pomonella]XP_036319130.1 uncharacterized protein LOC118733709 [Rhagoletis pomonella]